MAGVRAITVTCYNGEGREATTSRPSSQTAVGGLFSDGICKHCGGVALSDRGGRPRTVCDGCKLGWKERNPRPCGFDGCENLRHARGLCTGHWRQQDKGLELTPLRPHHKVRDGIKHCATCGQDKPVDEFHKKLQYVTEICRECKSHQWRAKNYGMSVDEVREFVAKSNCECCGRPFRDTALDRCVDHDHRTGVVRGFICQNCNTALGHVDDDVDHLRLLIEYIERNR